LANHPKVHSGAFQDWLKKNHSGKWFASTICLCLCSRSCQDSSFEGVLPVHDALDRMLAFTIQFLLSEYSLLEHCIFLLLGSMEVIVQLRIASIVLCLLLLQCNG
jgi:hypothetical protein